MARVSLTTCFFLRVDLPNENLYEFAQKVNDSLDFAEYIFCYENTDGDENPHMHVCFSTVTKLPVLRGRLRALGLSGNKSYSIKTCDEHFPVEVVAYICKAGKYASNLPESDIAAAIDFDTKIKNSIKSKKDARKNMFEKLFEHMEPGSMMHDIELLVMRYHIDNKMLIRRFQVQALVDSLYFAQYRDHSERDYEHNLSYAVSKYFEKK